MSKTGAVIMIGMTAKSATPAVSLDMSAVEQNVVAEPVEEVVVADVVAEVSNEHHEDDRILSKGKLMLEGIRPMVKDVLLQLVEKMKEEQLTLSSKSIIRVVRHAMELVEQTVLKGIQQRELVNELIMRLVASSPISEDQKAIIEQMIENDIVSDTIELVVDATKGRVDINQVREIAQETAGCCFAFWSRRGKSQ